MKLLHTADWHLGQVFFNWERKREHAKFLNWLLSTISDEKVDVLLLAGDIFDTPNPSAEAQKMYYKFLHDVTTQNPDLQIVIISGNHDSAARLEAPAPLLETMNITVRGTIPRTENGEIDFQKCCVPLQKSGKTAAWCLAVPYLRQGDYPPAESYARGVQLFYEKMLEEVQKVASPNQPIVALGHLQASHSEISDDDRSERIVIGGLEAIDIQEVTSKISYTALGHLHKAQRVAKNEHVRYSGTPLPMSFAEKHYKHGVVCIELGEEDGAVSITQLPYNEHVTLLSIPEAPDLLENILPLLENLPDGDSDDDAPFLEVKVLMPEPDPTLRFQVEKALEKKAVRLARISAQRPETEEVTTEVSFQQWQSIQPLELANLEFQKKYGSEMPEYLTKLLQSVLDAEN